MIIDKIKKGLNIKIVIIVFILLSIPYFDLPGLYMDAVNPDYVGSHIMHFNTIPAWIFDDNIIASLLGYTWRFPLLNSLYGTNFTAYTYILFSAFLGEGIANIRISHIVFGILELLAIYYSIYRATNNKKIASLITFFVAIDASFIFAQRTQYYLQLIPLIFFMFGISLLCKNNSVLRNNNKVFISSLLFGFAASSYFIFCGYYLAVFITFIIFTGLNKKTIKKLFISAIGFLIGYLPYLYAHISILLNSGLKAYINTLKGLDTYGISEGQSSLFKRVYDIIFENYSLPGGDYIINIITGNGVLIPLYKTLFIIVTFISLIISILYIIKSFKKQENINNELVLLTILVLGIIIHYLIGLIVGEALGYQHYIMALPLYYILIIVALKNLKNKINSSKPFLIIALIIILVNALNITSGYSMIKKTGGVEYYSSTINDLGYYLNSNINNNDLIICPQWGYSMGISIITQGKAELWNNTLEEDIVGRLNNFKDYQKIYIIDDNVTDDESINRIIEATSKDNMMEIPFKNENNTLEIRLLVLE